MLQHHALLLSGTYEWAVTQLPDEHRVESVDVLHFRGERMGIDEVRSLIEEAYKTPLIGTERVFVLAYPSYTEQSQNALLKLLEEPPRTARFYLITERPDVLLPTLRSRLMMVDSESHRENDADESFFRLSIGEQLEEIARHAKEKDEGWLTSLMESFEREAHERKSAAFMRILLELKPMFHMPGASRKMILEHLALSFCKMR
jgi:DNA polymerase III delta prime subunit